MFADEPELEHARLAQAMTTMHSELDDMLALSELNQSGEHRDILTTYRTFAEDLAGSGGREAWWHLAFGIGETG